MYANTASEPEGIRKYSKPIMGVLLGLFVIAVGVVLWYTVQKNTAAQQALKDITASQSQGLQTPQDKVRLLDGAVAAHTAAVTQTATQSTTNPNTPSHASASMSDQSKMDLLNSPN